MAGVAVTYALGTFALSPKPSDGPLVTGAWFPVAALGASLAVAAAVLNFDRFYAGARRFLPALALFAFVAALTAAGHGGLAYLRSAASAVPDAALSAPFALASLALVG